MTEIISNFITLFPYFAETDRRVKPVENGKWRADIGDDGPLPHSIKLRLQGVSVSAALIHRRQRPHREIRDQKERNGLPSRLVRLLDSRVQSPFRSVQNEDGLSDPLDEGRQ